MYKLYILSPNPIPPPGQGLQILPSLTSKHKGAEEKNKAM